MPGGLLALGATLLLIRCRFGRDGWGRALATPFGAHLRAALALGLALLAAALAPAAPLPALGAAALLLVLATGLLGPLRDGTAGAAAAAGPAAPGATEFRAIGYNVLRRQTRTAAAEAWLAAQKPDLVFLVEGGPLWRRVEARLAARLPWRAELAYDLRRGGRVRMVLLARHPITASEPIEVPGTRRLALRAELVLAGRPVVFLGLHAASPRSPALWRERDAYLAALARHIATLPGPVLVMGDFNATPADTAFRRFVRASGLAAAPAVASWPAWAGPFGIAIDHALAKGGLVLALARVGPRLGSDHRPLLVQARLDAPLDDDPPGPAPAAGQRSNGGGNSNGRYW